MIFRSLLPVAFVCVIIANGAQANDNFVAPVNAPQSSGGSNQIDIDHLNNDIAVLFETSNKVFTDSHELFPDEGGDRLLSSNQRPKPSPAPKPTKPTNQDVIDVHTKQIQDTINDANKKLRQARGMIKATKLDVLEIKKKILKATNPKEKKRLHVIRNQKLALLEKIWKSVTEIKGLIKKLKVLLKRAQSGNIRL